MKDRCQENRVRNFKLFIAVICCMLLFATVCPSRAFASDGSDDSSKKTVKIGYYEQDNFQGGASDDAVKTGYSYEYLQRLQPYTNWDYEYVYGEYGDLYDELLSGDIDILTGLAYTEDRADLMGYPDLPMGEIDYSFLKQIQRTDITSDPSTIEGKKIGALDGVMATVVQDYLDENGISAEIVLFENFEDRDQALIDGDVDVTIVEGGSTSAMEGIEAFADAGASDYYAVVTKDRSDILDELNAAQESLFKADENITVDLDEKWNRQSAVSTTLSESERAWIEEHDTFTVGYFNDFLPYSATDEDGNITGIVKDAVPELFSLLDIDDIEIAYKGYDTYDEMISALENGEIDVMFPAYSEYWSAEQNDIMPTNELISTYFDLVYRGSYPDMDTIVLALPQSNKLLQAYQAVNIPEATVQYYDTPEDCLSAVNSGEVDATLVNGLRTSTLLVDSKDYTDLHTAQIAGDAPLGFAANRNDSGTVEIMNHALELIDPDYALTQTYLYEEQKDVTLKQILSEYWWVVALAILLIAGIVLFFIVRELSRSRSYLEQETRRKQELEAANEEKLERIEEITSLNEQLSENQAQLEENAAEQEAQIEEITALNAELEDRQAQLEELSSEQQAQTVELEKLNADLSHQLDVIGGLSNAYFVCYSVNLDTGAFIEVKELALVHEILKESQSIEEAFLRFLPLGVAEEDLPRMKEFTDVSTLRDRLKETDTLSFEYRGLIQHEWNRASWVVSKRDETGRAYGVLYVVEEISGQVLARKHQEDELKEARDKANAANKAKSTFLFNMSHDIRTPMNAIIGFADLMERNAGDQEKCADYLGKIQSSSAVLLNIINNVLDMARIESGETVLEESPWSITQFTDSIYSVFAAMMQEKDIAFTNSVDVEHDYVYCDTTKLTQIFNNILSNSLKYTEPGGKVTIGLVELPSTRDGYAKYRTTVSDTGIGMDADYLPHLFEEFSRENTSTECRIQGTGLGMPIVKKLVDFMDGTIEVESEKGVGTTFIVTIEHRIAERSELSYSGAMASDSSLFEGKRILLAEDNDLNAEIAMEILGEAGFEIDRVEDGQLCVDTLLCASDGYYDVILMDIQMPNMNGYEATRTIRALADKAKAGIPILAMTANAFEEDKRNALEAGMNGHIAKPIDVAELMSALVGALR